MVSRLIEGFLSRRDDSPSGRGLTRVRRLFGAFALFTIVILIPMLQEAPSPSWRVAGLVAWGMVALLWVRLLRHGRGGWATDVAEFVGIVVGAAAVAEPMRALGVIYVGMNFRCLYGGRREAIIRAAQMFAAFVTAEVVAGGAGYAFRGEVLGQAPMFAFNAFVMGLLAVNLGRQDDNVVRQGVLARASAELLAATETGQAHRSAADASAEILGGYAMVVEADERGSGVVVAVAGDAPHVVGDATIWETAAASGELRLDLDVHLAAATMVIAERPGSAVKDDLDAVGALVPQVSMALERVVLDRRLSEQTEQLRLSFERSSALVRNASEVVRLVDSGGVVLYESEPVEDVLGWLPEEIVGTDGFALMHPDDRVATEEAFAQSLGEPDGQVTAQIRMRHKDGDWRLIEGICKNLLDDPAVGALVINYRDITERHELEQQLRHQALHDPLTELPNRDLFVDRVRLGASRARRAGAFVGVVYVDLDDFKEINDGFGHAAGDAVLRTTARRLADAIRGSDTAARLGGDEFAVLLDGIEDPGDAYDVVARVLEQVRQPIEIDGQRVTIGASVGIVLSRGDEDADELLRRADVAMYEAKDQGKGRFEVFELGMHAHVRERLALRSQLEAACSKGEIVTYYQPVVDLTSGRTVGVEALVRWEHPERGLLSPAAFIDAAERTGLIVDIGRIVLDQACGQVAAWNRQYDLELAVHVNVSPRQLMSDQVIQDVRDALTRSGLSPDRLTMEITESMLISDAGHASDILHQLRALGVRLALDDFGTGYSSLAHLQRFPIDVIKIDRSFIAIEEGRDGLFTRAIVGLGTSLGIDLIAEGIERPDQADRLKMLGCPHGQGFLYARPMPADDLSRTLADAGAGGTSTDGWVRSDGEKVLGVH